MLRRTGQLVCDAFVWRVLSLATSSFAVVGCSTGSRGDDAGGDASNDAGAGVIEASMIAEATTEATTDGPQAQDSSDQEAGMVDAGASDATSFDGPPADSGGLLDAPPIESGGGGGTLCGATCGPGQMLCPSPPFAAVGDLGAYDFLSQAAFTACFPKSNAGCGSLNYETCAGGEVACPIMPASVCAPGLTSCSGLCYDLTSDTRGCGTCGNVCTPAANGSAVCIDSKCVVACLPGWTACGNTCSVMTTDASNCGACGHACAAGEICTGSACVAQSSVWLATGLTSPSEINVDQNNVYWSDSTLNSINGVPKNGGSTFVIVSPQSTALTSLAFDDVYLYYWQGSTIMRALKEGNGAPQVVAMIGMQGLALGVDSTSVYFTGLPSADPATIQRVPKGGGTPTTYLTIPGPVVDAVSDNLAMYVMVNNFLILHGGMGQFSTYDFAGTVGGPNVTGSYLIPPGYHMAVDATNVYAWYEFGIEAFGKYGGFGQTAGGVSPPIAGASCGVAWANSSGINWSAFVSMENYSPNGFFEQAGQLIAPGVGPVVNLIADGDNVYWTDSGHGAIGRLRLP
jgi:hypothetical protein